MPNYAIGIDLGGTKILTGLVNKANGEVLYSIKQKTGKAKDAETIVEKLKLSIKELLETSHFDIAQIDSIGIGAPGQVNREKGILVSAPNLNCENLNLKAIMEREFFIPTHLGNDVEIATLGEMKFGAGRGFNNFVCVFVGTGVGSGIAENGKVRHGATGTSGEIGHIIVDAGGRPCGCGGNGCLEAYASRTAIEARILGALKKGRPSVITEFMQDDKPISSKILKKALEHKDELVTQALFEASDYLSNGLATVINFYNPELIILGGGLIDAIDEFYERTITKARAKALPIPAEKIQFKKAQLGDFSGVVGACFLQTEVNIDKVKVR